MGEFHSKKRKPWPATRTILISFFLVILIGSLLLELPVSNVGGVSAGYLNNLFVATSNTCVTGLTPIVVAEQYTWFGQVVLIFLMQIGGLGFMTIVAVLMVSRGHKLKLSERGLMQDALSLTSTTNVGVILRRIMKYVAIIEGTGFLLYATQFVPEFGLKKGLFVSLFTAVSAFVNAGFDNIGPANLQPYVHNIVINATTTSLIILGGIGFMVWFDVTDHVRKGLRNKLSVRKMLQSLTLHTKFVLFMTLFLLISGTILIFILESQNPGTMKDYTLWEKIVASFFQSTTLRTAGFSTIDFGKIYPATAMIMILYMFIGGSPGGTAGGVKTTTFGLVVLGIFNELRGVGSITLFKKQVSKDNLAKALAIMGLSFSFLFIMVLFCVIAQEGTFLELWFEAVSALATVGLSLNLTPTLDATGKIAMILLMYIGRVGVMTVGVSMSKRSSIYKNEIQYPHDHVQIG